jgi:Lipocalin-like domain
MIELFKSMSAYAGTYAIDGNKITHHVDASWNEAWTGTQQARFFKLENGTLTLTTASGRGGLDGRIGVSTLVWERPEQQTPADDAP